MSNPILNEKNFSVEGVLYGEPMTMQGTINKIFMLFVCLLAGGAISIYSLAAMQWAVPFLLTTSFVVSIVLVIATCFNIKFAKYTAAPYAFFEGILLGSISAMLEAQFSGIVLQAILATLTVFFVMLMLYKTKTVQYTNRFAAVLQTSLLSILAVYVIDFIASFFGRGVPGIFGAGIVGIAFSLFVIVIAAMALIQDLFFIENASQRMLSKDYEWYGAMGLMITLIWLYVEVLRLLAKLNSRN